MIDPQVCEWECGVVIGNTVSAQHMTGLLLDNKFTFADTFLHTTNRNQRGFSEEVRHDLQPVKQ